MTHELKISPEYFDAVAYDIKPFEVRFDDRGFHVGDTLWLREYAAENTMSPYTGRTTTKIVTYVLSAKEYCKDGYVILGLARVPKYQDFL